MANVYLLALCLLLALALAAVLLQPARIYQYSYFMAAGFGIFIMPQVVSLIRFPGGISSAELEAVLFMTCLCFVACLLSARLPIMDRIAGRRPRPVSEHRLFHAGIALTVIGYVADHFQTSAAQALGGGPWTGSVTIYNFFASLVIPAFAIALRTALLRGGVLPWLVTAAAAWPSVEAAVFFGRREVTVGLIVIVGITWFYQRRVAPPRTFIVAGLLFAMVMIPATGTYRSLARASGLSAFAQLDLVGNFQTYLDEASILELRNAAVLIDATSFSDLYQFGTGYWDQLVWRFVPAQFLGADLKGSLMFQWSEPDLDIALAQRNYHMPTGSTVTGIGDAFLQFGYFGSLFFLVLGVFVRSLWVASLRPSAIFAQLLYVCTVTSAIRAITHQTVDYLPGLIFYVIFLGTAVWYARSGPIVSFEPPSRSRGARVQRI